MERISNSPTSLYRIFNFVNIGAHDHVTAKSDFMTIILIYMNSIFPVIFST